MSISRPENMVLNRVFAVFFVVFSLIFFYYTGYGVGSFLRSPVELSQQPLLVIVFFFSTLGIGFPIILFGLFREIWRPSLDLTFHCNRRWIFASIVLFVVVVLSNSYWWIAYGRENLLAHGWSGAVVEFLMGNFAVDTSILSLMLGILFLTKSTPNRSPSYKTILIGVVFWDLMCFIAYLVNSFMDIQGVGRYAAFASSARYANFLSNTIFQLWFWLDLTYGIVTFTGALWLLRTSTDVKKLILGMLVFFGVILFLGTPLLLLRFAV